MSFFSFFPRILYYYVDWKLPENWWRTPRCGSEMEFSQLSEAGMASTRSVHTVRKATVVTSTSCHSTRSPHRDHCYPGQLYHAHITFCVGQYGARIVTYSSVVKLLFTLRASARAVAPESPISFLRRLWTRVSASSENQFIGQSVGLNIGLCHH